MGFFTKVRKVSSAITRNIAEDIRRSRKEAPAKRTAQIASLKQQVRIAKLKGQLHRERARTPSGFDSFFGMQPTQQSRAIQPVISKKKKRKGKNSKKKKRTFTIEV